MSSQPLWSVKVLVMMFQVSLLNSMWSELIQDKLHSSFISWKRVLMHVLTKSFKVCSYCLYAFQDEVIECGELEGDEKQ